MKCPDCLTYPKAENCIRCYHESQKQYMHLLADHRKQRKQYREQKKLYLRLVADLRMILATTAYHRVGEQIELRLDQEGEG